MNDERPFSEFSGVAGRVLDEAISPLSFVSGLVLGSALLGGVAVLALAGANAVGVLFAQVLLAFALARFALNGLQGEWSGTVFSAAGGGVPEVAMAALRYLAMSAIVIVPALMVDPAPALMGGAAGGAGTALFALWFVASILTPPVFLIMAVTVTSFGELASPQVWRAQFSGRLRDLFALYVVYIGALATVALAALPFLALAFAMSPRFGVVVAGAIGCLLFGISVNLAGRLCGFFACGELGIQDAAAPARLAPAGPTEPDPAIAPPPPVPVAGADTTRPVATASPPAEPPPLDPLATRVVESPTAAIDMPPVAAPDSASTNTETDLDATRMVMPAVGDAAGDPDPGSTRVLGTPAPEPTEPVRIRAVPSDDPWPDPPRPSGRRPPLLDAAQRVDAAMRRFTLEPASTVGTLQELNAKFAPDPHVLSALAMCFYRGRHEEKGVTFANQALPLVLERGLIGLAVDLFRTMRSRLGRLALDDEALLQIAAELARTDDLAGAAKAYSAVIGREPDEARAIKGLLQVAERLLEDTNRPDAAVKVYRYLLERCSASPLVEFMRSGLADAERVQASAEATATS